MIYLVPDATDAVDQGDIIDGCPLAFVPDENPGDEENPNYETATGRVVVLTQTCDLAQGKTKWAVVAVVLRAQDLVDQKVLKASDVRGSIRAARVFGLYFLPADDRTQIPESIVDLRQLHTVPLEFLATLSRKGHRRARIKPLYREHLARHFGDTYSRIGLPEPYPTE